MEEELLADGVGGAKFEALKEVGMACGVCSVENEEVEKEDVPFFWEDDFKFKLEDFIFLLADPAFSKLLPRL